MRCLSFLVILAVVALGSGCTMTEPPKTKPQPITQEQVVAEIEKCGGEIKTEGNAPDAPVIGVGFGGWGFGFPGKPANTEPVTDALLEHLRTLDQLHSLGLMGTQVTDSGMKYLESLSQLHTLNLDYTKVSDAGLEHLQGLSQLQSLSVTSTNVTDRGVKRFQTALPKCRIVRRPTLDDQKGPLRY